MMRTETITSARNPKIKQLAELQEKSRIRKELGMFVVEGRRELERCLRAGYREDSVFICPEIVSPSAHLSTEAIAADLKLSPDTKLFEITPDIYSKLAYRDGTEGIVAEIKTRSYGLQDITLKENPLIVVLESVEKPGNLGAVLRSADAAAVDAVLVCNPLTDLFNPNLIRASLGAVFSVPMVACNSQEAIAWLKSKGIKILTAQLQDSSLYYDCDMKCGTAIVMGTESTGLTDSWRDAADAHIRIPMLGMMDSLNVSVSAAILLFEAVRQRLVMK